MPIQVLPRAALRVQALLDRMLSGSPNIRGWTQVGIAIITMASLIPDRISVCFPVVIWHYQYLEVSLFLFPQILCFVTMMV